ncbi:MAG: carboxypeptidase-like regulatory domain-containing protein [Betaproteobacteria bacterium]
MLVGVSGVAMAPVGVLMDAPPTGQWGRLLRLIPVASEELHDVRISAWRPEHPAVRPRSRRLLPEVDKSVAAVALSPALVWIAGFRPDPDAYLLVEAPEISTVRVPLTMLAEGPPDVEAQVRAEAPVDLDGRVETKAGEAVSGATVELLEPLVTAADDPGPVARRPLLRRGITRTQDDGGFAFRNLGAGAFYLVVSDRTYGRGAEEVETPTPPVVVRLTPPRRARGRVLRGSLPVPGARVRFVADAAAWAGSSDPMRHIAEETQAGPDGRFSLSLPPDSSGSVQVILPGTHASIRLPIPPGGDGDVDLGDVAIPDPLRISLRLLNADDTCAITATGPLSGLGLTQVRAAATAHLYSLELPEPGAWALSAECGKRAYGVQPSVVTVSPDAPARTVDVVLVNHGAA